MKNMKILLKLIKYSQLLIKPIILFKNIINIILVYLILMIPANAEDLINIYSLARQNDPQFIIKQQNHLINLEKLNIAKSKLLPNMNLTANQMHVNNKDKLHTLTNNSPNKSSISYETSNYSLNIEQPIFNLNFMSLFYTAKKETLASLKNYEDLEQELLLKVIMQYFSVLSAMNKLEITKVTIDSLHQQLEKTTKQFNIGLATINDINAAKAKLDNVRAQKIQDLNLLNIEKEKISQLTGKFIHHFSYLKDEIPILYPEPNKPDLWLKKARENNLELQAARYLLEAADEHARAAKLENWPTINLAANIIKNKTQIPMKNTYYPKQIGITLNLPIFSGGATIANSNTVELQKNIALQKLEATHRDIESNIRINFHTISTTISQIHAWQQSIISNKIALESNEAAFEAGTKTIIEVLNSEIDLLYAKHNYMQAKYEYIIATCKLKRIAGSLSVDDLHKINNLLITNTNANTNVITNIPTNIPTNNEDNQISE